MFLYRYDLNRVERNSVIRVSSAYPFPGFVVQRTGHVYSAGHVFDGKCAAKVSSGDLVTYSGRYTRTRRKKQKRSNKFTRQKDG